MSKATTTKAFAALVIVALLGAPFFWLQKSKPRFPADCTIEPMIASLEDNGRVRILYYTSITKAPSKWSVDFTSKAEGIDLRVTSESVQLCTAMYETYDKVSQSLPRSVYRDFTNRR